MNDPFEWARQENIPVMHQAGTGELLFHSGAMFPKKRKGQPEVKADIRLTGQRDEVAAQSLRKGFSGVFAGRLESIWSYKKWTETNASSVFAYDLETLGADNQIVEMAFQSKSGQSFHRFVRPENLASIEALFTRYEKDPMSIYQMSRTEQRTIADLVRYSTIGENAFDKTKSIHNRAADGLFQQDRLYVQALSGKQYLDHMRSGLASLSGFDAPNTVAAELQDILNPDNLYVGHNSRKFDMPLLKGFMERNGQTWRGMTNHLDTYDLLRTVFPTMDKLLKEKGKTGIRMGDQKLQALVDLFGLESEAHSALGDTGEGGLLGILDSMKPYVDEALDAAPFYEGVEQGKVPSELQLSNFGFGRGDIFYTSKAWGSYDGAYRIDLNGNIIEGERFAFNSRQVLGFDGFEEIEDADGNKGVAAVFFDDDAPEVRGMVTSFGDNAHADLQEKLTKMVPWQFIDERTQEMINHTRGEDLARRRYEGLFGLSNRGRGNISDTQTRGYFGAKRMYENTEAYVKLMQDGVSEEDALKRLNFNSQWDAMSNQFVFNEAEYRDFKMLLPRLRSELGTVKSIIDEIDSSFAEDILRAEGDGLLKVRQQMEESFLRATEQALPQTTTARAPLPGQERFTFYNPLTGRDSTISVASPETFRADLDRMTRLDEEERMRLAGTRNFEGEALKNLVEDDERLLRNQRLSVIARALVSQGIVVGKNGEVEDALEAYGDPYNLQRRLAEVIQPEAQHDRIEVRTISPRGSETLEPGQARILTQETIGNVRRSFNSMEMHINQVVGQKARYSSDMNALLNSIDGDAPQAPGSTFAWSTDHRGSLEKIMAQLDEAKLQYSVFLDEDAGAMKVLAYTSEQADQIRGQIAQGKVPVNVGSIDVPIIDGHFQAGRRKLNARPSLRYNNGNMDIVGPMDFISDAYDREMRAFASAVHSGDGERASAGMRRALDGAVNGYAGSQGIVDFNDGLEYQETLADRNKQYSIDTSDYVLKKMIADGELGQRDFNPGTVIYDEGKVITSDSLTMDMVSSRSMQKVYERAPGVLEEQGIDAYYGGVKSDHAGRLILGQQDVRAFMPGGWVMNPGRDNPIQWLNTVPLDQNDLQKMAQSMEAQGVYFEKDPLISTKMGDEFRDPFTQKGLQSTFSMKAVHMTPIEIRERMEELAGHWLYQPELIKDGYLIKPDESTPSSARRFNVDGERYILNPVKYPSTYENSAILNEEVAASRTRTKRLMDGYFEMDEDVAERGYADPGEFIGRQMGEDGRMREVHWEGKSRARLEVGNNEVHAAYEDNTFKWMADTEKFTHQKHSQWLIGALAGDSEVGVIFNPDLVKHKDWGIWVNGRMRVIADEMRQNADAWDEDTMIRVGQKLEDAGYSWDSDKQSLIDFRDEKTSFNPKTVDALLADEAFQYIDNGGREKFIVDLAASDVGDYSKIVGGEGRQVLGYDADGDAILGKFDGVRLGWRELNVLQEQGLGENRDALMEQMIDGASEEKGGVARTSALQRAQNTRAVYEATLSGIDAPILQVRDLNDLPMDNHLEASYKDTIFDMEGMGAYLQLPTIDGLDGKPIDYTYEAGTSRESSRAALKDNKIFIPNVGVDGVEGQRYLDALNGQIANIFKKAKAVEGATSTDAQRKAQQDLQGAIDGYFGRVTHDLTSSKGHFAQNVSSAQVSGISGLYRMVDPLVASELDGDFEFLTDNQAKALGIFDKLQAGEEVYGQTLRYPSFHGDSMASVQYRLGGDDDSRLLGTAFTGFLERGDQDGDQKHSFIISQSEQAQAELKRRWQAQRGESNAKYDAFMQKVMTAEPGFDWRNAVGGDAEFQAMGANTDNEIAAKIGKRLVGMTSNLNLQLRQLADQAYEPGSQEQQMMYTLGETIEQKLISSKHGLSAVDGKIPALAFMDNIKQGTAESHQRALEIASEFIGPDFVERTNLASALDATRQAVGIAEVNLRNPAFQIGSSGGITADISMADVDDILSSDPGSNSMHQQMHRAMNHADGLYGTLSGEDVADDWTRDRTVEDVPGGAVDVQQERPPVMEPDLTPSTGGGPPTPTPDGPNPSAMMDDMLSHVKRNKRAYAIGGAAVGALSLYNMFNNEPSGRYAPPPSQSSHASEYETSRGYKVVAQARGKLPTERIEGQVRAWTDGNLHVEKRDNTKRLDPRFYRDQVEGYI